MSRGRSALRGLEPRLPRGERLLGVRDRLRVAAGLGRREVALGLLDGLGELGRERVGRDGALRKAPAQVVVLERADVVLDAAEAVVELADPLARHLAQLVPALLEPAQAHPLGYLDPLLTITGFRVLPTVVVVDPGFQPVPEPGEVAEVFEVPLEMLLDPGQLDTIELQFGGRARHVFQYRYQPQRIWGATASILYNLRERLAGSNQWRV